MSFWQIWVEQGHERARYTVLYAPSGTQWSKNAMWSSDSEKFKKYFSFNFILTDFSYNNYKFVFCFGFWAEGLEVNAQNPKLLILQDTYLLEVWRYDTKPHLHFLLFFLLHLYNLVIYKVLQRNFEV
jgi:hypothetical protein